MSSSDPAAKPHSAEYFGQQRDLIALMARRWQLEAVHRALDVGAGVGHWGRLLLPHLAPEARVFGIDRQATSIRDAHQRAQRAGLEGRLGYRLGEAERIPFHDGVFDLVTGRMPLLHVRDPRAVVREMMRVLEPGGLCYFLVGGGTEAEFERLWGVAGAVAREEAASLRAETERAADGGVHYLVSGRKF